MIRLVNNNTQCLNLSLTEAAFIKLASGMMAKKVQHGCGAGTTRLADVAK